MSNTVIRGFYRSCELKRDGIEFSYIFDTTLQNENYVRKPHGHYMYELQCALSGTWELHTENCVYTVEPSKCIFIPSFALHNMVCRDEKGTKCALRFLVNTTGTEDFSYYKLRNIFSSVATPLVLDKNSFSEIFSTLASHTEKSAFRNIIFDNLASALILLTSEQIESSIDTSEKRIIGFSASDCHYASEIELAVLYSYANPQLTLKSMAEQIHLSTKQVERICNRIFGCPFGTLLARQRMYAAKHLIEEGYKLADVAEAVGYNSYTAFYRCYKSFYGHTPAKSEK